MTATGAPHPADRGTPARARAGGRREKKAQREREQREALDADGAKDTLKARREALETKATSGDVYANRELRENHDYYYGGPSQDIWELLTREQRAVVRDMLNDSTYAPTKEGAA